METEMTLEEMDAIIVRMILVAATLAIAILAIWFCRQNGILT